MTASWINVALGVWLCVATVLFARGSPEVPNELFLGLSIFLIAFLAMGVRRFRRLNTLLGLWAVISPFTFGYHDRGAGLSSIFAGLAVIAASLWTQHDTGPRHERPAV